MGTEIQFQRLRAAGFNLNLSKVDEWPHRSISVICTLSLLTASFGCLHKFTPNGKLHHDRGFFILQTCMLQLGPIPAAHTLLHLLTWARITGDKILPESLLQYFPMHQKHRNLEEFTRNSGKTHTLVHKPKPFEGIKIHFLWAAELTSVLLLLSDRIPGSCSLATLVFVILRTVLHLFVPLASISVKWALHLT